MTTSDFDFDLPPALIAQTPLPRRDASRLLVLDRAANTRKHMYFTDLPDLLRPGDCLVINDSRVLPARLFGVTSSGAAVETLLLRDLGDGNWICLTRPGRRTRRGTVISYGDGLLTGTVTAEEAEGSRVIHFSHEGIFLELLDTLGEMPLPPYIKTRLDDPERYQTVYARVPGSAAAPTAGLHFTPALMDTLRNRGVLIHAVTLHVGLGTFRPVKAEDFSQHTMHAEYAVVSEETARAVNAARDAGGRVIAVGTTACRTLESFTDAKGRLQPCAGFTDIFITPGYHFRALDGLITNFHLPRSTLLMLVSALAGREAILEAYREAISLRYRFFSFGDAMFIGSHIL
ncbi:MAG: tRNA preQ1(34) S-adenosylmethionine ribosyltransferase-isomerase QueA [Oscillospiraceae bacterium]|jgi:S-adenosylmethionine:tRNA ribosyltransferase-isomerase|nr:tRNA preQ1(34) S-adenosylmethionine ribosyltransferase-isomerase QueA [Oscillospiraceae bacterium]